MKLDESLLSLLPPGRSVGSIRTASPVIYIFSGGDEDAAFFSINGFSVLIDSGDQKEVPYWNLIRNYDKVSAVISTRVSPNCLRGLATMLTRKTIEECHPFFGAFVCNIPPRNIAVGESVACETIRSIHDGLHAENLKPIEAFVHPKMEPISLYEVIGEGALRMIVLNPERNSKELQNMMNAFKIGEDVEKTCASASLAIILVWQPSDQTKPTTRILFPGACNLEKLYSMLEKCKGLEYLRQPVHYAGSRTKVSSSFFGSSTDSGMLMRKKAPTSNRRSILPSSLNPLEKSKPFGSMPQTVRAGVKEAIAKKPDSTARRSGGVSSIPPRVPPKTSKPPSTRKPELPVASAKADDRTKKMDKSVGRTIAKPNQEVKSKDTVKKEKKENGTLVGVKVNPANATLAQAQVQTSPIMESTKGPEVSPSDSSNYCLKTSESSDPSPIDSSKHLDDTVKTVSTVINDTKTYLAENEKNNQIEKTLLDTDVIIQPVSDEEMNKSIEKVAETIEEDKAEEQLQEEFSQPIVTEETKEDVKDEIAQSMAEESVKLFSDVLNDTPLLDSTPDEKSPLASHEMIDMKEEYNELLNEDNIEGAGDFASNLVSSIVNEAISEQGKTELRSGDQPIDQEVEKILEDSFNANLAKPIVSTDQTLIDLGKESDRNDLLLAAQDAYEDSHAKIDFLPPVTASRSRARTSVNDVMLKPKLSQPLYFDIVFIPHHGPHPALHDQSAAKAFATSVRSRRYVLSGQNAIRTYILDGIIDAKNAWNQPDLEVDILPTHDSADLTAYEQLKGCEMSDAGVNLRCSVERCTLRLTSGGADDICSAFKFEL